MIRSEGKIHLLGATEQTVHVGYWDNSLKPVLTIDSGDTVVMEIWGGAGNRVAPGMTIEQVDEARKGLPGPGFHSLTGPVAVRGAMPGDVLEVQIKELIPKAYGYNSFAPGHLKRGFLPEDFPQGQIKHFYLDLQSMTAEFAPGIVVPLRPFLGNFGVAPREAGRFSSNPPGDFGGNMDCKDLTVGSITYFPVMVPGALFSAGDGHAAQGDGEVNITAIECGMRNATLQFFLRKDMTIERPMAETASHWITMGFHEDLDEAAKTATRDMIAYLHRTRGLTREDAYALCSIAVDVRITQVVNGVRGAHAMLPKSLFVS
jgi:acetamidase/formamidase